MVRGFTGRQQPDIPRNLACFQGLLCVWCVPRRVASNLNHPGGCARFDTLNSMALRPFELRYDFLTAAQMQGRAPYMIFHTTER